MGDAASWWMGSSGFILSGLEGKMGSFGKLVHLDSWMGAGRDGYPVTG